jgi:hypothetical protein
MKRTNIYLTSPSVEKLKALSLQHGLSVAELIRRAIDEFLKMVPIQIDDKITDDGDDIPLEVARQIKMVQALRLEIGESRMHHDK